MSLIALGAIAIGAAAVSAYSSYKANQEQAGAASDALEQQSEELRRARAFGEQKAKEAGDIVEEGAAKASRQLGSGISRGIGEIRRSETEAKSDLTAGAEGASDIIGDAGAVGRRDIEAGQAGLESALAEGFEGAEGQFTSGLGQAGGTLQNIAGLGPIETADVTGTRSRLGELFDQGFDASSLANDPGFQFRQQQGEQAINRAASARGGRLSGRTLQELGQFNQGLASQEYDKAFQRQTGLAGAADQQGMGLAFNQAGRQDAASLAGRQQEVGALGQLAGLQYGTGSALGNLLAQQGQIAGQGAANTGSQLANLGLGVGGQQAGLANALGQNLANTGMQSGSQLAQLLQSLGAGQADIFMNSANSQGNFLTGNAAQNSQLAQMMAQLQGGGVPYAGAGTAALGQAANQGLGNLGFLMAQYYGQQGNQ